MINTAKIVLIKGFECYRCNYRWQPRNRNKRPTVCPHCRSAWWDVPRKNKQVPKIGYIKT